MHVSSVRSASLWLAALCVTATTLAPPALAQTGVSDDRVSLPDGPGSLDGMGDNASVNENMGMMNHSLPIMVPDGWAGVTPSLSLSYSSGGGASVAGVGWSMSLPTIERMTARGLPLYDDTDIFVANGGAELVRVDDDTDGTAPATYRARFEGGFVRYTWHERGGGDEGYWTAESPDGITSYFGADSNGTLVETARQRSADGVFRYLLVESLDLFGHRVEYNYNYFGSVPLISSIAYLFDGDEPSNVVTFSYEARDDLMSDAKGGFNELLGHRLSGVLVSVDGAQLRRYAIDYEPYADAGGVSRISQVRRFGADDGRYPATQQFTYSRSLGGLCTDASCEQPYLVDIGNIGVDLAAGQATLMDMNGDALPDFLVTSETEAHRIYLATYAEDGTHSFASAQSSQLGNDTTGFRLNSPYVQVLDYNGDGFTDIINAQLGQVLVNEGGGDWARISTLSGNSPGSLVDFGEDFDLGEDTDLAHIRFLDYDLDRKIDVIRSENTDTSIYRNNGDNGFAIDVNAEAIGAGFADENLEFADMNGDGLLDPVILRAGEVSYRLNLGRGRWSSYDADTPWTTITNAPVSNDELPFASFEDLNGDGLDDLVVVIADEIRYALNRNATTFSEVVTLENVLSAATGDNVSVPARGTSTVLFADMNANGSNDVVWVTTSGDVTYLELFPVRPNLLARIENGLGLVYEVEYVSAVDHRARDNGVGWDTPTPLPMLVVDRADSYVLGIEGEEALHNVRHYSYHAAYYDGIEKQFRGFAQVDAEHDATDTQEGVRITSTFDVGDGGRPAFAGRLLHKSFATDGSPLQEMTYGYDECDVEGIDANVVLTRPIVWACQTSTETVVQERRPASEWLTLRKEKTYDGYGNVVQRVNHGVIAKGGGSCDACTAAAGEFSGACGATCTGDEFITETDYVSPDNATHWLLRLASERRVLASHDGRNTRIRMFYDGADFEGGALGTADVGLLMRTEQLLDDAGTVKNKRYRYDAHGNVVEEIHSGHDVGQEGGRYRYTYNDSGQDIIRQEKSVAKDDGVLWMHRDLTWDDLHGGMATSTMWTTPDRPDEAHLMQWVYDEHGRLLAKVLPGDTMARPTETFEYQVGETLTAVVTRQRIEAGSTEQAVSVQCFDGKGRMLQHRTRVTDDKWLVSGLSLFNAAGAEVRVYEPFEDDNGTCSWDVPDDHPYRSRRYDGLGREIEATAADAADHDGVASVTRTEYRPLLTVSYDERDTDDGDPLSDVPSYTQLDGLGRATAVIRPDEDGNETRVQFAYDDLGNLARLTDVDGHTRTQRYDLAGRVKESVGPDRGTLQIEHDIAGNPVRETRANGVTVVREYDQLGRKTAEYEASDEENTRSEYFYDVHPNCPMMACANTTGKYAGSTFPLGPDASLGEGEEAFSYDARDQIVSSFRRINGAGYLTQAEYNGVGAVTREVFPGGIELNYEMDGALRPVGITGFVGDIEYDARQNVVSQTYGNGVVRTQTYNARGLLSTVQSSVTDLAFTYDRITNITQIDDALGEGEVSQSGRFEYDALGRLASATLKAGTDVEETVTFAFDAIERLRQQQSSDADSVLHLGDVSYDGAHPQAMAQAGGSGLTYDASGLAQTRGDDTFTYDLRHMVQTIVTPSGTTTFGYTGASGEVIRVENGSLVHTATPKMEVRDGVARLIVALGNERVAEIETNALATVQLVDSDDNGVINAADAYAHRDSDDVRTHLRSAARSLLMDDDGTHTSFLHTNHLGSVIARSDAAGDVVERIAYAPYGGVMGSTAKQTETAAYVAHDVGSHGYINFGQRMLAPHIGRFLTPDPLHDVLAVDATEAAFDAVTSYAYARSNPIGFYDVGGLSTESSNFKKYLTIAGTLFAASAAMAGFGFAVAALTFGSAGVANVLGGIAGAIVSGVAEYKSQKNAAKAAGKPFKLTKMGFVRIATETIGGFASGFATLGVSAGVTAATAVADHYATKSGNKTAKYAAAGFKLVATGAMIGVGAAGAFDSLATAATDAGFSASSVSPGVAVAGENASDGLVAAIDGVEMGIAGAVDLANDVYAIVEVRKDEAATGAASGGDDAEKAKPKPKRKKSNTTMKKQKSKAKMGNKQQKKKT